MIFSDNKDWVYKRIRIDFQGTSAPAKRDFLTLFDAVEKHIREDLKEFWSKDEIFQKTYSLYTKINIVELHFNLKNFIKNNF